MRLRVAIIGSGIIGSCIARVLSMYENFSVTLIEREFDVGWGSSKANSSVIHPGHEEDPERHPLRAKLCKEGNILWRTWAKELDIPVKWPGELMVFFKEEERRARKYIDLAKRNGIPSVKIVPREELLKMEPILNPDVEGAVYAPTTGVIDPFEAVIAIVENAVDNSVKLLTETEVRAIKIAGGEVKGVLTNNGFIDADIIINAAGIHSDEISHMAGVEPNFKIRPRRGEYILFDEDVEIKPTRVLHTTPTEKTKGVYGLTTIHGNLMIGPTAEDLPPDFKERTSTTNEGLEYLWDKAKALFKELPPRSKVIRSFAGLRAEPLDGRWLIRAYTDPWGFINVAGIRSPGFTAAPAIAHYVLNLIRTEYDVKLIKKDRWNPYRRGIVRLADKSLHQIDSLIRKNPDYGEIICYCKLVSKAEILEAIERMRKIGIKTITLDGIKYRTRAGFGRCQGAFCRWKIALLVSEYAQIPLHKVVIKKSPYGIGDVKVLLREGK